MVCSPLYSLTLCSIVKRSWPPVIQLSLAEVSEAISSREAKSKRVLQLLKQKPKSIKFYEPKFDEVYVACDMFSPKQDEVGVDSDVVICIGCFALCGSTPHSSLKHVLIY